MDTYATVSRMRKMAFTTPFDFTYSVFVSNCRRKCIPMLNGIFPKISPKILITTLLMIATIAVIKMVSTWKRIWWLAFLVESLKLFSVILRQPLSGTISTLPSRIMLGSYILAICPVILGYLTLMRSNVTFCDESTPETFRDLREMKMKLAIHEYSTDLPIMEHSMDANMRYFLEKSQTVTCSSGPLCLERVLADEKLVFLNPKQEVYSHLYNLSLRKESIKGILKHSRLLLGSERYFSKYVCFPTRLGLSRNLVDNISRGIQRYFGSGLWNYAKERVRLEMLSFAGRNSVIDKERFKAATNLVPINTAVLRTISLTWALGLAFSTFLLLAERIRKPTRRDISIRQVVSQHCSLMVKRIKSRLRRLRLRLRKMRTRTRIEKTRRRRILHVKINCGENRCWDN